MKKTTIVLVILILTVLTGIVWYRFTDSHTFLLRSESAADSDLKSEEIQPVCGFVKVRSTEDTNIRFTDAAAPETVFQTGTIASGVSKTVRLESGRWYTVQGAGDITVQMVNVRVQ